MMLSLGSRRFSLKGFTLLEILAVITLITVVFAVATLTFTSSRSRLSSASYTFTEDIQGLYAASIKNGKIHRLKFSEEMKGYSLEIFEMPTPRPVTDDRKAVEKWEDEQKLIEESWKNKRKNELTRIDRGIFRTLKERKLGSSIKIKTFLTTQSLQKDEVASSLLFYPSGETEQALIVIEDSGGQMMSLEIDSLSGRVKTLRGEVTLDQWKKELGIK